MTSPDVPYEAQQDRYHCGPAALSMVYRSLGLSCTQAELRARVTIPDRDGFPRTYTSLLAHDALRRGLPAWTVRARFPEQALRQCLKHSFRVVLNHRFERGRRGGHYSVLAGLEGARVVLHDPFLGPRRCLGWDELLELWAPAGDVSGFVFVAVAPPPVVWGACLGCRADSFVEVMCGKCGSRWPLPPPSVLGCEDGDCRGRSWACCFCPGCDAAHG
jgi:hypothetical protein